LLRRAADLGALKTLRAAEIPINTRFFIFMDGSRNVSTSLAVVEFSENAHKVWFFHEIYGTRQSLSVSPEYSFMVIWNPRLRRARQFL